MPIDLFNDRVFVIGLRVRIIDIARDAIPIKQAKIGSQSLHFLGSIEIIIIISVVQSQGIHNQMIAQSVGQIHGFLKVWAALFGLQVYNAARAILVWILVKAARREAEASIVEIARRSGVSVGGVATPRKGQTD